MFDDGMMMDEKMKVGCRGGNDIGTAFPFWTLAQPATALVPGLGFWRSLSRPTFTSQGSM